MPVDSSDFGVSDAEERGMVECMWLKRKYDNELPIIWFIAEVLRNLWETRAAGKPCRLQHIRASVIAECEMVRLSKYGDIAIIIDLMV